MRRVIIPLLVLWLGIAGVVSADPLTLTSGTIVVVGGFVPSDGLGSFNASGSGFSAGGSGGGLAPNIESFSAGMLDLSGTLGVSTANSTDHGSVTLGTQTLSGYASATFQVTGTPVVIADAPQGTTGAVTPFSASGMVLLFANRGDANPIVSQAVTGTGTMSIGGISTGGGQFLTQEVGLTFNPADTTPEPASMLLLGTGLAAAWQSRRFRRARDAS